MNDDLDSHTFSGFSEFGLGNGAVHGVLLQEAMVAGRVKRMALSGVR